MCYWNIIKVRCEFMETELREKPWLKGTLEEEVKWWDGKERWAYPLLKRVVRRALLEVLSRLNGATEGNIESITLVSLTYSPPLSVFLPHDSPNISPAAFFHSLYLHSCSFFPCRFSLSLSLVLEVITAQSANQINSYHLGSGRHKSMTFSGKCHL